MKRLLLIGTLLFSLGNAAYATNRVWLSEWSVLGGGNSFGDTATAQIGQLPTLVDNAPIDITSGVSSIAVSSKTTIVRICVEAQTAIKGAAGATSNSMVMFAATCEYFGVAPSSTVSFILAP